MTEASALNSGHVREDANPSLFNLAGILLLVLFAGIAVAYIVDALRAPPQVQQQSGYAAPFADRIVAGAPLHIPVAWFRATNLDNTEFVDQLDLLVFAPFSQLSEAQPIDVRLMQRSAALTSAYLLDKVYLHQFSAGQLTGAPGLIGQPLRSADGFQNETVWYDPLSSRPFVAKCAEPVAEAEPTRCIRTVNLTEGLSATFGFDRSLLAHWRDFDNAIGPYLDQIGAL